MLAEPEIVTPDEAPLTEAEMRAAVAARDGGFDGRFVYAVRSTGVYCRPSCPSRAARPENLSFHAGSAEAEAAGFRPCRRCRPDEPALSKQQAEKITRACRLIEAAETPPSLDTLARAASLSPFHFHRIFKAVTGVTPRAYAQAHRAARAADSLAEGRTVTESVYAAGYGAPSRFYAGGAERLGMSPSAYRKGGAGERICFATDACALGLVLVAATVRGVCAILLGDDADALRHDLTARFPKAAIVAGDADFAATVAEVVRLVAAPGGTFDLPLDIGGTAFQQRVWQALRRIPVGTTATYAEIARAIGEPAAVRAVAMACGANALAVAIPCHRVVRSDGALSGYRWGTERKTALLAHEGVKR
ncbi:UNVERIFIED_ORG: AraC family transcriptional regulator of adaptative response/methylated-DNA-[protein]-cysteine methyltransferase [Methylobacterium sp. SuP10 SLI 274]|uniref:bifunctional DNA-binding transcriptional regulator/O6-methylguanine-DNA methyltransferase Ada n=1 Tax=Methylorubrum extorquens TaxID=408 RepID=UPI00209CDB97|nr:bifunctional DNA-binding transcriptional regulator/O6-methylguanine-DNA methyltransferase Ada [Methylorubrum extorquens]MDF9863280.1 AraC family transcriptional regulator of adaptative response/methylated-DNA-[protein]-cysteine methyltransferase [Methylorubrum pseudosasae]MDH6636890.1 AraC family transcriptional regulator of adaptative response/methylated-DNA-[protein]-cysteine methyltransferase [Methylobacterium sp. SuP10 SLI 274]MDH6666067.1 AraC family transcriptional regulator of adaptati